MDDLVRFWRARLDEAERVAREAGGEHQDDYHWQHQDDYHWHQYDPARAPGKIVTRDGSTVVYDEGSPDALQAAHIALNDPASALADVAADRALLAELEKCAGDRGWDDALMLAVRIRAARFSDHPGYRKEWAP